MSWRSDLRLTSKARRSYPEHASLKPARCDPRKEPSFTRRDDQGLRRIVGKVLWVKGLRVLMELESRGAFVGAGFSIVFRTPMACCFPKPLNVGAVMQRTLPATRFASTKREAAAWLGVSVVSLDAWIAKGCPTLPGRGPRKEIAFDLMEVCRWRFGAPPTSGDGEKLDAQQEKALLDAARRAEIEQRLAVKNKDLIPVADYRNALVAIFKPVANFSEALPDELERKGLLSPEGVEAVIAATDDLRERLYQDVCRLADQMPTEKENESHA